MKTSKEMNNLQIAELLRAVAAAYELKDADRNKFRIIAYQRASDAIEHASSELKDLWDDAKLDEVPGIGKSIAEHLDELFRTGKSKHFEAVMKGLPPAMFEFMELPGVGAKTGFKLAKELGIKNKKELEKAAKSGKIAKLEGFGEESQGKILTALEESKGKTRRMLLPYAKNIADGIIAWMKEDRAVEQINTLGSLRREAATVGDIDIAVASNKPDEVLTRFTKYPKATRVIEKGDRTASIIVPSDIQIDLMVQPPEAYGALLQHFTGSKHHNIALREYAIKHGMSLSEYGIKVRGKPEKFASEQAFYKKLGMDWIPPELREDSGEIESALSHKLPVLVELADIKADLQIHSSFDIETSHDIGASTMEEVIQKADTLNYEYIAFTEHNPSKSRHNDKQIIDLLMRKRKAVDKLNYSFVKSRCKSIQKVFNSLEIDILPDGGLPVPDEGMATLDFALVSIHSSFDLPREKMTLRVLKALEHPKVRVFAHPTARKLNEREGVELDWPKIFDFCSKNDKWLEINTDPIRLDLPDTLVKEAVKEGIMLSMGTDAHHKGGLDNMQYGITVARRGWASKNDIVNTRSLKEFEKMLF